MLQPHRPGSGLPLCQWLSLNPHWSVEESRSHTGDDYCCRNRGNYEHGVGTPRRLTFIETDNEGNGILRWWDIKNVPYAFDIPLTPREFEKLWMRESNRASRLVFRSMENQGEHLAPNETRAPGISRKPGVPAHAFTVLENEATLHGLNCDTTSSTDRSAVDKGQKDLSPLPED